MIKSKIKIRIQDDPRQRMQPLKNDTREPLAQKSEGLTSSYVSCAFCVFSCV